MINKPVYQVWSGTLRFGNVAEQKMEGKWRYLKIDWVEDGPYQQALAHKLSLRKEDYDPDCEWYRIDRVEFFEPNELIKTINKLR